MSNYKLKTVEENLLRLLAGEKADRFTMDLSEAFELIATRLFCASSRRDQRYFDGVVGLVTKIVSPRKIEFSGEMWIGDGLDQRTEGFRATITDQRITKQGFRIVIQVGAERAEGEIASLFAVSHEPPHGAGYHS